MNTIAADPADPADARAPAVTAEGEAFASERLRYTAVAAPEAGASAFIAPGVRWARIPLPLDLNHINVWLVDEQDGCITVDTGLAASIGKDAWECIARDVLAVHPLRGVFVTHIHPDHIGLARWLQERFEVPVWMSARTLAMANSMLGGGQAPLAEAEAFFRSHGAAEAAQLVSLFKPERFARMTSGLPQVERLIADGEALRWGAEWRALETNGHAEGHLCLWNAAARVLISGDQVLPTISSNISLTFRSGDVNPLGSYMASLQRLRALPDDTLVLPSHGAPFYGLQQRIDDLLRHHHEQLAIIERACTEPRTAVQLLPLLFRRELKGFHLFLALGEAVAHLEYLVDAARLERRERNGVLEYRAAH